MDCSLLIFDFENRILPQTSTVCVVKSDGRDVLLQKLGYSATEFWLYVVPNSSLWAGSQLVACTTQRFSDHKEIGRLLFEGVKDYSLVVVAKRREKDILERNDETLVGKKVKYSTPDFDSIPQNVDESGYLTYDSNLTSPTTDDVIITSSSPRKTNECTAKNEIIVTIISDSEDKCEDPLSDVTVTSVVSRRRRRCALPGIFSERICPKRRERVSSGLPVSPFHSSSEQLRPKSGNIPHLTSNRSSHSDIQNKQIPLKDETIVISSSDEAFEPTPLRSVGKQSAIIGPVTSLRYTPPSSDEGIVLDSLLEESSNVLVDRCSVLESNREQCLSHNRGILNSSNSRCFSSKSYQNGSDQQQTTGTSSVIKCCGFELSPGDLKTLRPHQWLNDQVINCYMNLLMSACGRRHKVHIMSTFFYTKLVRSGYAGVERWMKRVKLNKLKLLLVPVHLSRSHWALAAVNLRTKIITYFDSLQIRATSCLKNLKVFLLKYAKAHKCRRVRRWRLFYAKDIPRQQNGDDCGVFVCQFAKWLCSRRMLTRHSKSHSDIPFQQRDIPSIRRTMLHELKTGVCTF